MINIELLALLGSVASITLAIVSIWLARTAVRDSQANFEKTSNTLSTINERAAGTEKVVGEHFDKLMETVLSIVNTATTGPEVRKAELESQDKAQQAKIQEQMFEIVREAIESGDPKKVETFTTWMNQLSKLAKP